MNMDPRRTVVGNLIDDSLALGMARTLLGRVEAQSRTAARALDPVIATDSIRDRKESLLKLRASKGPFFIGMTTRKNYWHGRVAYYVPIGDKTRTRMTGLAVFQEDIDLRSTGPNGPEGNKRWPYRGLRISAVIEIHAIARFMQRSGNHDPRDVFGLLRQVASWSTVATRHDEIGSWMLPTENGLVCARNCRPSSEWINLPLESQVVLVKTFIDKNGLRTQNAGAWNRLVENGALAAQPKLPDWNEPTAEQDRLWALMRDEGRGWDMRRAHAMSLEAACDPEESACEGEATGLEADDIDAAEEPCP